MGPARKMCVAACLSAGFLMAAAARGQTSPVQAHIAQYEQELAQARAAGHVRDVRQDLIILGYLYRQAWAIWDQLGVKPAEAMVLNYIAAVYYNLGDRDQALKYLNQALAFWSSLGDQGETRRMMGARQRVHDIGQWRALKEWNDALPPEVKENLGHDGEASTFDMMGQTYSAMGRDDEAIDDFNRTLPLWEEAGQQGGQALTLDHMGRTYSDLGQKQNALDTLNHALEIWRTLGNRQGEGLTLDSLGRLYRDLGLQQTALDYYNQASPIFRETGTKAGEGLALNDIGRAGPLQPSLLLGAVCADRQLQIAPAAGRFVALIPDGTLKTLAF